MRNRPDLGRSRSKWRRRESNAGSSIVDTGEQRGTHADVEARTVGSAEGATATPAITTATDGARCNDVTSYRRALAHLLIAARAAGLGASHPAVIAAQALLEEPA
jgi:hypothetical protein